MIMAHFMHTVRTPVGLQCHHTICLAASERAVANEGACLQSIYTSTVHLLYSQSQTASQFTRIPTFKIVAFLISPCPSEDTRPYAGVFHPAVAGITMLKTLTARVTVLSITASTKS